MMKYLKQNKLTQSLLWVIAILTVWELSARIGLVSEYLLPPFSEVYVTMVRELFSGKLGVQTVSSLRVVLIGFFLSFVLSVVVTALCTKLKTAETLFNTLSTIMNPLPAVAIMPLIIMWFGIDETSMYVIIVHGILWSVVQYLLDGLRSIPKVQMEFAENIGLSPVKMFAGVVVFALMPNLLAGLRVGWGRAWRALIGAEMVFGMIGTSGGLGYYIYQGRAYARIENVFAGMIIIAVIGIITEQLIFNTIEKQTTRKWGMTRE